MKRVVIQLEKKDRKGPTNIGINRDTLSEYETWKKSRGEDLPASFTKEINKVTPALAKQIYNEMYYKRYNLDKIENQGVAEHLLDITINQGPYNGAVWLQEALNEELAINMKVDGTIGPTTRKAIQEAERKGRLDYVHNRIIEKRKNHYKDLAEKDPSQKDFLKGWLNRAESFRGGE